MTAPAAFAVIFVGAGHNTLIEAGNRRCQHFELFLANGLDPIAEHDDDRAPFAIAVYISSTMSLKFPGARAATTPSGTHRTKVPDDRRIRRADDQASRTDNCGRA
jgi:hypothetical protein